MNEIEVIQAEQLSSLPEVQELEDTRSKFLAVALTVKVTDQKSLVNANAFFLDADARIKAIDEKLDPKRELAYRAYQEWLKLIKELKDPYLKAKAYLNGQVTAYHQEIEKKRREEEEIARQTAIKEEMDRRKTEEEARIAQAAELEKAGANEEAEALVAETVEENQKPIEIYVPPAATPKAELEGATVKVYWSAEVTDLRALCRAVAEGKAAIACIEANMTVLNAQARSLKKELNIPGVRAISTSSMAATGRRNAA